MSGTSAVEAIPEVLDRLENAYPGATYELNWSNPLELLVATILAAQCTDERVNRVTATLFQKYPDAKAFAEADLAGLEEDVKPTGFFRQKAKTVQGCCRALLERFDGQVPRTLDELVTLPGVARKTGNVVLNCAFDLPSGVIVDTHVSRVAQRMGLTRQTDAGKIEADLMRLLPRDTWTHFGPAMVLHGRYVCMAKKPMCGDCIFTDLCPKLGVA